MVLCPECQSLEIYKDGFRYVQDRPIQRYLCRICGHRFSEKKNISTQKQSDSCQICVTLTEGTKNLTERTEKLKSVLCGKVNLKGELFNFAWHLQKMGRSESTILTYSKMLKVVTSQGGELNDPESVKSVIANHFKDRNTQRLAVCAYDAYLEFKGGQWKKPNYKPEHKQKFIPTDEELKTALNSGTRETIIFQTLQYETGARLHEGERLERADINQEKKQVTIKSSKNGKARTLNVSENLITLLLSLQQDSELVFKHSSCRSSSFHNRMVTLAKRHNNPRFLKISLHTFRHCKALREYHKTKSILHVKRVMGHRSILTTQRYVDLYEELYETLEPTDYNCETATTPKEAKQLIESGFEYVCEIDGVKMFRKVKLC